MLDDTKPYVEKIHSIDQCFLTLWHPGGFGDFRKKNA